MSEQDPTDESCSSDNENLTFVITEPDVNFDDVYPESVPVEEPDVNFDDVYPEPVPVVEQVEEEISPVPAAESDPLPPEEDQTLVPVDSEPVVEEPVDSKPVVEEPVDSKPVVEEPVVIEEPVVEPVDSEPVVVEPVVEEPVEEPVVEPVVEEPVVEEPPVVIEEPPVVEVPVPTPEDNPVTQVIPKIIFIVPYRNRESHYKIFSAHMNTILQDSLPYKIFYIHQTDNRSFNRGAMKNIGFLAVQNMYPNDYANITLVLNDIDTMPRKETILDYFTEPGTIKHFYGFNYTLGGIVSINALDFEKLNGFPNFWAWGYEDNLLQIRAEKNGIQIDRNVFFKIHDPAIIHLVDTPIREVNRGEYDRFLYRTQEGISSIHDLVYDVDDKTGFINVLHFTTSEAESLEKRTEYDLRNGPAPFQIKKPQRRNPTMRMHF